MKKIYLSVLASLAFMLAVASPDIYAPELLAPSNNQAGAAPNVELDWNAVTGQLGLHYEAQLAFDEAFTNPAVFTTELTAFRTSNLLFGTQYFWRVRAIDNQGASDWSVVRNFTTIAKPVIRRPNDGSTGAAANVQIIWEAVQGIAFFDYQLDISATFDSTESHITSVAGSLSQTNASRLLFGKTYYLRMRMRHAADTSEWSVVRSFTVVNVFALKKPNDNSLGLAPNVELEWNKIDGLSKYNIYIANNSDFDDAMVYTAASTLTKTVPDTLNFGVQYFWKMAAIHSRDTLMSDTRTFSTIDKVMLNSPTNNATNTELTPFLKWEKISGTILYKLELASNQAMTGAFKYNVTATTTSGQEQFKVPNNILDSTKTYYWRVLAISSRDTSNWSDTWNFRCVSLGVEEPAFRNGMKIYPSPATETVNIQLKSGLNGKATITLFDLLGKARIEREVQIVNGMIKDFQLGLLSNGIYMLRIDSQGVTATSKLIVKR